MFAGLFSLLSYRPRIPHARAAVTLSEADTPTLIINTLPGHMPCVSIFVPLSFHCTCSSYAAKSK